jgi:PAS domain S-box-containing protein
MSSAFYNQENSLPMINEDWFDTFINNSPAVAWLTDEQGNLVMVNDVFKELVGLDKEAANTSIWELFPADLASVYHKNNMEVLRTKEILRTEEISVDKFGNTRSFIVYKFPVITKDNKTLIGGWSIDITEKKATEQKLMAHSELLKEIAFLQSHEVRRPLSNMLTIVELLEIKSDIHKDDELIELLSYLKQSAIELDMVIKKIMHKTRV